MYSKWYSVISILFAKYWHIVSRYYSPSTGTVKQMNIRKQNSKHSLDKSLITEHTTFLPKIEFLNSWHNSPENKLITGIPQQEEIKNTQSEKHTQILSSHQFAIYFSFGNGIILQHVTICFVYFIEQFDVYVLPTEPVHHVVRLMFSLHSSN